MGGQNELPRDTASILGPSLRFKGELHAQEDLLIRGKVEGSITHSQQLTICRDGQVKADIEGPVIAVEGTVPTDGRRLRQKLRARRPLGDLWHERSCQF